MSSTSYLADQVADLPHKNGNFRFLLIYPYYDNSDGANQVANLPPENVDFRFLLIDSYSESSDVADQVADLPAKMAILDSY